MIRADLHIHTIYSLDSTIQPKIIVNQLFAHSFIKAIAITDHNTIKGYYKVRKLASAYKDVVIIPGVEISTVEGDLIVLGVEELPREPWTAENVIEFARKRGGVVIAAHPYREYGLGDLTMNYDVDAIEVLNGRCLPFVNQRAEKLAKVRGLPGVAGSDAHKVSELWTVYTEMETSPDVDEILKILKKGLVTFGRKSIHF